MTKIEIICGIYGYRPIGSTRTVPIGRRGICEVSDEEAQRLSKLGVARVLVDQPVHTVATPSGGDDAIEVGVYPSDEIKAADGAGDAYLDADQLKDMTVPNLRELAIDMGIEASKLKTKAQLIDAITAVPVQEPDADSTVDQPPDLGAEPPVL